MNTRRLQTAIAATLHADIRQARQHAADGHEGAARLCLTSAHGCARALLYAGAFDGTSGFEDASAWIMGCEKALDAAQFAVLAA